MKKAYGTNNDIIKACIKVFRGINIHNMKTEKIKSERTEKTRKKCASYQIDDFSRKDAGQIVESPL